MKTSFWTELFDLMSPRTCAICGDRLSANEQVICATCHLHLPLTRYELSPLDNPMARLFWGRFPVEKAAALFFYEPKSATSRLIYEMKYHGMPEVAEAMGELLANHFCRSAFFEDIDALVPMPITRRRKWQRGYNQSQELARGISSMTAIPIYNNVLRRQHFSQSQTTQHAWERIVNVDGAFCLTAGGPDRIAGKHVLLVDDIVTTGATITACGRELAKVPGVSISILSVGLTKS